MTFFPHSNTYSLTNFHTELSLKYHLVTGGAGFIGSCYVLQALKSGVAVVNLDKLTYAGNLENLAEINGDERHTFVHGSIENEELLAWLLNKYQPTAVVNFAAESHVDRSIVDPDVFVRTNVLGTAILLRTIKNWWEKLPSQQAANFRMLHVSTDEVYGTLSSEDKPFTEMTPYSPNSPYSASKAASDHLVRAFHETYGLPTLLTNCSNNYGPRQFPEKLIPLIILNALQNKTLPVYGTGENIRDWLHVEDHCEAIRLVLEKGKVGQTYNIGGQAERTNISIVKTICSVLDEILPQSVGSYSDLIQFVTDRPGHDFRYAIDCSKIKKELGWSPRYNVAEGLAQTVRWYLNNTQWVQNVQTGAYRQWLHKNYETRDPKVH